MPKLTLTDKEKVNLELYINFLVHNSNPCNGCSRDYQCCVCPPGNDYRNKLAKYDVADLLSYPEIEEYVTSSVKLNKYRAQVQSMTDDIHNLEKKISEIMESIDIGEKTEFYCNACKIHFAVPDDECEIAFDGEGGLDANVYKYHACPKCTKICWHSRL